jgi:CRISPR-associated protein Csy2
MSQYVLINRIKVQGANAVAGFTWGFPAITHFLGFSHNLGRKLAIDERFVDIQLSGCTVIAHQHQVHTYGYNQFTQSRNPAFQYKEQTKYKVGTPPVIEEGKMDMEVSLLIACDGNIGNRKEAFLEWLNTTCILQRLAGGTILEIADIDVFTIDDDQNKKNLRTLIRKLLPGFVLQDRSNDLEKHFQSLQAKNPDAELFDAWLDFIALKQKARPAYHLIDRYLLKQVEANPDNEQEQQLLKLWQNHLEQPYEQESIPTELIGYFEALSDSNKNKKLLTQWQAYCTPTEKTDAVWEYVNKPEQGFLVPIMVGYKAISQVYENHEVANTRDDETDVCLVEAVHSIGEWQSIHRIRDEASFQKTTWHYHYEENWYLCKQNQQHNQPVLEHERIRYEDPDDDFS